MKTSHFSTLIIFCLTFWSFSCAGQSTQKLEPQAFSDKINAQKGEYVILDVRTDEEVAQGMIKGAQQLDFNGENFEEKLGEMDKDVAYFVYCAGGGRSGNAVSQMSEMGFMTVYDLDGGINAWIAAGFKLKK